MEPDDTSSSDSTYSEPSEVEFSDYADTDISDILRDQIMSQQVEEEIPILRRANTRLRHNMELLRQRLRWQAVCCLPYEPQWLIGLQKIEHGRELDLIETIDSLRTPRPNWKPLPTEVLHSIMLFTLPPDYFLHHSSQQAFYTPWCKVMDMKLSLISVSKAWYHAALPLLYEDVVFHHVGPIAAFLETLRGTVDTGTSNKLAALVRSVHVSCLIPAGFGELLKISLVEIKNICPSISVLGFSTSWFDRSVSLDPLASVPLTELFLGKPALRSGHPSELSYASHVLQYNKVLSHVSSTLQSLELYLWNWGTDDDPFPQLSIPSLIQFTLHTHSSWLGQGPPHMESIITKWQFPVLERLTFPGGLVHWIPSVDDFLTRHGSLLQYLHFNVDAFQIPNDALTPDRNKKLQATLDACPLLEHLVLYDDLPTDVVLRHPRLKYIDVWHKASDNSPMSWHRHPPEWGRALLVPPEEVEDAGYDYMQSALPRLEGIRSVDYLLRPLRNLLVHLKPLPTSGSPYFIDVHGMILRHEVGSLFVVDNDESDVYVEEHFPSYYLESDEESLVNIDYLNDEEESDVSWDSDEVLEDGEALEANEEDEVPEDEQVDEQTVLEMYRQTLV